SQVGADSGGGHRPPAHDGITNDADGEPAAIIALGHRAMGEQLEPMLHLQGRIGLAAWTPAFQSYSALQMQHRFELFAHRPMTERDYGGWLAVSIVGDAVMRGRTVSPAGIRAYLRSDRFLVAGFKGQGLTFRSWDQQ